MSLEYLSKYLNKDVTKSNKRKRDKKAQIIEDDLTGWTNDDQHDAEETPMVVEQMGTHRNAGAGFRPAYVEVVDAAAAAVGGTVVSTGDSQATMQSGARAGLQTKAQVAADERVRRQRQLGEYERSMAGSSGREHETVYRDATGRRIDIALAKQEKAREVQRQEERKKKEKQLSQGLVQQREKEAKRAELARISHEGFSRRAGDADTEAALRGKDRWDDPAAAFLSERESHDARPVYKGGFAPNRFSIRPGYRWDGVDRGNGHEAKRFKEMANLNQRRSEYEDWAKEDM